MTGGMLAISANGTNAGTGILWASHQFTGDANQAVRVMLNEIARLQHEPIDQDDIKAVIAQFLTTYYMGQETNAAQAAELAQYE